MGEGHETAGRRLLRRVGSHGAITVLIKACFSDGWLIKILTPEF